VTIASSAVLIDSGVTYPPMLPVYLAGQRGLGQTGTNTGGNLGYRDGAGELAFASRQAG
jgi:hypothetical protein